jgi:hypothetical protein
VGVKFYPYLCGITLKIKTMEKLAYYEIYDDCSGKTLFIEAHNLEEAIELSEKINFDNYNNLEEIEFIITEETEVFFTNDEQLSYQNYNADYIELYIDDFYIGLCEVWFDSEMDDREYITLNYTIVYLDTIKLKN